MPADRSLIRVDIRIDNPPPVPPLDSDAWADVRRDLRLVAWSYRYALVSVSTFALVDPPGESFFSARIGLKEEERWN